MTPPAGTIWVCDHCRTEIVVHVTLSEPPTHPCITRMSRRYPLRKYTPPTGPNAA